MTSGDEYLKKLLKQQQPSNNLKNMLHNKRESVERFIRDDITQSNVRFYFAGSYKKETMINESFDLDIDILS